MSDTLNYSDIENHIESLSKQAILYKTESKYEEAIETYNNALKIIDKYPETTHYRSEIFSRLGEIYKKIEKYQKAKKYYIKSIKFAETDIQRTTDTAAKELFHIGNIYFDKKEYNNTIKIYKILEYKIQEGHIYDNTIRQLGECYDSINNYKKAIEYYIKYLNEINGYDQFILKRVLNLIETHTKNTTIKYYEQLIGIVCSKKDEDGFYYNYYKRVISKIENIYCQLEEEKLEARIEERDKVIEDLSHHIKNLISTIMDPLENLKQNTNGINAQIIENALKGSKLIQDIVSAMNLSFKGTIDDFYYDAKHNTGKGKVDFKSIFIESLRYSIGHMFDGKYFQKFKDKYFPSDEIYEEARCEWSKISQSVNGQIYSFLSKYFFEPKFFLEDAENFIIGNDKGSAIKLLILFQELILNAVKYSAYIERERRYLQIQFKNDSNKISIKIENPFKSKLKTKTSGMGHEIINNFINLLKAEANIKKDVNYSFEINFANFWKEKI